MKGKLDNLTIIPIDFNSPPSVTDIIPRGKDTEDKNTTTNINDLTFIEHSSQQQQNMPSF